MAQDMTALPDMTKFAHAQFIDGAYCAGEGPHFTVINPATLEPITTFREASTAQVERAIAAARRSFDSGIMRDPHFRRELLTRMADLLEARKGEFCNLLVQDAGTPVSISEFMQVSGPLRLMRDLASRADMKRDYELPADESPPASRSLIRYEPIGVVAAIGAYNNPLLYIASKALTAMAAGCSVVFCPSMLSPLAAVLFGEIARDAGVPAGVLNIIAGGRKTARFLSSHPQVDKVSLTGSVAVGREVMAQAAPTLKGLVLELGGKSPGIVLPGADIAAISMPLHARYLRNAGQGCQSPTRLFVPADQMDAFIEQAQICYQQIPIGDPTDPKTLIGPLISEAHRASVEAHIERAIADGGRIVAGGGRPAGLKGAYLNGTLIAGLGNDSALAKAELFGPVAMVIPYHSCNDLIEMANDSEFGLAATLFGPIEDALTLAPKLRVGTVQINGGGAMRVDGVLAGWKQSGLGKEWGEDGIREFLEVQHIQWPV